MNEQELIIQGNQASALMPELKRYIDEQIAALSGGVASKAYVDGQITALSGQIAALSEKDKDTLFINFSEVGSGEKQILLYISKDNTSEMHVYTDAYIPEDSKLPPKGYLKSIEKGIHDKYCESYPWLNEAARRVVDGYIVLEPVGGYSMYSIKETPWLRLCYSPYAGGEPDAIEQHLGMIRRLLGDDSGEKEDLIQGSFLSGTTIPLYEEGLAPSQSRTFRLRGWMLLKNS